MKTEEMNTKNLFTLLDITTQQFEQLVSHFDEEKLNAVPFEGSWTAAQVASHVTKSNNSMVQALQAPGKPAVREQDGRVEEIKNVFLNFTTKLKSPEFIVPTEQTYEKATLLEDLQSSVLQVKKAGAAASLSHAINHLIFKEITKYELLSFVIYHTQRHIHQLQNIAQAIHHP